MTTAGSTVTCSLALDSTWLLHAGLPATASEIAALQDYADRDDRLGFATHLWRGAPRATSTHAGASATRVVRDEIATRILAIRVSTLIAKLRHFQHHDLHATKIVAAFPELLAYKRETVTTKLAHFARRGLNPAKIINAFPPALGLASGKIDAKLANLARHGLDAPRCINTYPQLLGYAPKSVTAKIVNLARHGIDTTEVITTFPGVLGYAPGSVDAKIANLEAHGIDSATLINAFPQALGYAPERVALTIAVLQCMDSWELTRRAWNNGMKLGVLTVPIESLALMAGLAPESFVENPLRAKRFANTNGWTTSEARRRALEEHLDLRNGDNAPFINRLGTFAVLHQWRTRGQSPFVAIPAFAPTASNRSNASALER